VLRDLRRRQAASAAAHALALLALLGATGCKPKPAPRPQKPLHATIAPAMAAVRAFDGTRPRYLELRRAIASGLLSWRGVEGGALEVMIGPPRQSDEGGGALAALDAAMESHDLERARDRVKQIEQALRLIDMALGAHPPGREQHVRSLVIGTWELGMAMLEALPSSPAREDAVRADLDGMLGGMLVDMPSSPFTQQVEHLRKRLADGGLNHRIELVHDAAELGRQLRYLEHQYTGLDALPYVTRKKGHSVLSMPAPRQPIDDCRAEIGKRLFTDTRLSRGKVRSCASCHDPKRAYTDGLRVPKSLDPATPLVRNTPTLLYAAHQAAQLWDGRVHTPESQAIGVIHARAEMGLEPGDLVRALAGDAERVARFQVCFPDGLNVNNVAAALGHFEARDLVNPSAPIDGFQLTPEQSKGLDVFAGKARCTRCHIPPTFGGSRPPDFSVPVYGVLGVPAHDDPHALDGDLGRGALTRVAAQERAFKTPTLRNLTLTAPYMHNGVFATLEEVVDFYDKGGGTGAGLTVANQDPDVRKLELTADERQALLVFLREALRDR
jgi:cytochrome c peroxidase